MKGIKMQTYQDFLESKIEIAQKSGFPIDEAEINPVLKPHQRDAVKWAVEGGCRALFEAFGLGKTLQELEWCRLITEHEGGQALIIMPLGVKQEFKHDAVELLGMSEPPYVRSMAEILATPDPILITNYERVRDGDIDVNHFTAIALDEAAVLRSMKTKLTQQFLVKFKNVKYRLVATATPSPNRYKELIFYSDFLGIMPVSEVLTRYFKRDSKHAHNATIYPNKESEFWLWVSSWALYITTPSDLGYDDTGYVLPPMKVNYHRISACKEIVTDRDGQVQFQREASLSLQDAATTKRESIPERVAFAAKIVNSNPDEHFILWHDLEAERHAIKKAIPEAVEIYGSQPVDVKEQRTIDFAEGKYRILATKKEISGSGCNFQRHCHRAIFVGIDYEFNDFIQAIHRIYRFLQSEQVIIDIIYTEEEDEILSALKAKWERHNYMIERMKEIVKKYGLSASARTERLKKTIGVKRVVVEGKRYKAINNDCVEEMKNIEDNSIGLIHTSIPFSNQFEYTPSYNDFGHNENTDRFFKQMDYLTPELLRILKPGRIFACHVKDRTLYGNMTGTGMTTIEPFHCYCIEHYMKHGFEYIGMITVVTDVVRENAQTYRLGWSEQCKDGTKMGVGCPEYVLLFRKRPTDNSTAYADEPVTKEKSEYSRAQWQLDAHGYWRCSGDRLISTEELNKIPTAKLQAAYNKYSQTHVYNYEEHVELAEQLDKEKRLPTSFMCLAPASWAADVWTDITRIRTLNSTQARRNEQMHVCLAEGTLILTRDGYKTIENVKVGDVVLTHKGNWKPVIATACTGEKETVRTVAVGVPYLITTPDHKLYTRTVGNYPTRPKDGMKKTSPKWIEAKDTIGGYVNLKLPSIEDSSLTAKEWWIIGRYLADGHKGTRKDYFISVGKAKQHEFEEKAQGYFGSYAEREALQYRLLSSSMSDKMKSILDRCGRGAENKQVPIEGLCLNKELSEALLSGYLSGDGNITGNAVSATSVSRALLLGMAMVVQRARNRIASVYAGRKPSKRIIQGREVNCKQEWIISWKSLYHTSESEILLDGAWKKVKKSIPTGIKRVYSLQVADDASYTAEGCIVKNCPLQLDIVERIINRYSNEGDIVLDPFGGLMSVPMTAVKMHRYGIGIELNPDYFRDGVGYLKAAEEDIDVPTLFDYLEEMDANAV